MWLDNASAIDMLFYSPYAETIVNFSKSKTLTPLTIGLYGSWGAGKSSLLKIIEDKLSTENRVVCVSLNAWQFEGYEDAKVAIMESLLKALNDNKSFAEKAKESLLKLIKRVDFIKLGKNIAKKGLPYALGALTGNPIPIALNLSSDLSDASKIISGIKDFKDQYIKSPEDDSEIENIRKFRSEFQNMLFEVDSIDNLTIIIDDLDRCTPERIIDTLEAIKLFLSVEKTTFIVAVDQRIVQYAVKTKYERIDGYEIADDYIEKIIQLPIKIPELSPKDIENYLLLLICQLHIRHTEFMKIINEVYDKKMLLRENSISFNEISEYIAKENFSNYCDNEDDFVEDAKTIEKIKRAVSSALKGNPRQAKRFLNTFFVRKKLSMLYFGDELEVAIIAKLLALEIIDKDLFRKLNEWNKLSSGEIEQLKKLEEYAKNESQEIDDQLRKWTKTRIINWLNSEPVELYKQDLSKYFYLSRESLSCADDIIATFNDKEREVLLSVINCRKGQESNKIDQLKELSIESQEKIINALLDKFKMNEIELSLVAEMFVRYSDVQVDICDVIKAKEKGFFTFGVVPHFKKMYNSNSEQISELISYLMDNQKMSEDVAKMILPSESCVIAVERGN